MTGRYLFSNLPQYFGGSMEHTTTFPVGNEGRQVFWKAQRAENIFFIFALTIDLS
jgi:hypothetical protein